MSKTVKNRALFALMMSLVLSAIMIVGVQIKGTALASSEVKTVSEIVYTMENGASIYNNVQEDKRGIRFGASMSEEDYTKLMNNVGAEKEYASIKFGVVIAPKSYEDANDGKNALNYENLFGENAIYDWATWNGTSWEYDNQSGKIRVINIETNKLTVKENKASVYGSITTILPENLLTEFKGVSYIIAEKNGGGIDKAFATENNNVRTVVYVAQVAQQNNLKKIATLDPTNDALQIAELTAENTALANTYLKAEVLNTDVNYTVEHYYAKPSGDGYFLYETTTETGKINSEISVGAVSGSNIAGVEFDSDNANNSETSVIYAQGKSIVKAYYDVAYANDSDKTEKIYNIGLTSDYAVDSGIEKVYSADMTLISNEGVIENAKIVEMGKGERNLYVLTENGFEEYSAIMATHVISTADEFVDFFNSYSGSHANNGTTNWYAVVTADIDLSEKTKSFTSKGTSDYYNGTFNGLGHVIDNLTVASNQGLFGYTSSGVEIKNFALTNVSAGAKAILSNYLSGKASNIYVQGTANSDASLNRPVLNLFTHTADVSNVIVNISGSFTYAFKKDVAQYGKIDNCYVIGAQNLCNTTEKVSNCALYEDVDEFYSAEKANLANEEVWNGYWKKASFGFYFGNALIALDVQPTEVKETKYLGEVEVGTSGAVTTTKDHVIDLKAILGESPEIVIFNGEIIENVDSITVNASDYEYGKEYSLVFGAGETVISQPFTFATHVISTEDEFVTFIDFYSGGNFDPTKSNGTQTWYAVLTKDLDMTGKTLTDNKGTSDYYSGTFDGLGHYIDNLTFVSDQGLFGYTSKGSVLKNFAIININAANKYVLSGMISGTIENVYLRGEYTMSSNNRGPLKLDANNATLKNTVLAIKTKTPAICLENCSTASSRISSTCYVMSIRAFAGICGWTTSINGYCDEEYIPTGAQMHKASDGWNPTNATLLLSNATFIADISAGEANGWSKYWDLQGDATNGYTLKFGNATVGTTAQ